MAAVSSTQFARLAANAHARSSYGSRSPPGLCSRRALGVSVGIVFGLQLQQVASARDIPLFGIRKRDVEKVEKVIEEKVEEIVKEGEQVVKEGKEEANAVLAAAKSTEISSLPLPVSPGVQAGAVAAAELLGVAVASSIVNGLVTSTK